jgi:hypothetical protein
MRKLCWLWIPLGLGMATMLASCGAQNSVVESGSRSASIRVVVAPGGDDVLRTQLIINR